MSSLLYSYSIIPVGENCGIVSINAGDKETSILTKSSRSRSTQAQIEKYHRGT